MYNDVCLCICIGVDYKSRQFSLVEQCGPPGDRISSATLKEPELTEVPHHYQNLCSQWLNGLYTDSPHDFLSLRVKPHVITCSKPIPADPRFFRG